MKLNLWPRDCGSKHWSSLKLSTSNPLLPAHDHEHATNCQKSFTLATQRCEQWLWNIPPQHCVWSSSAEWCQCLGQQSGADHYCMQWAMLISLWCCNNAVAVAGPTTRGNISLSIIAKSSFWSYLTKPEPVLCTDCTRQFWQNFQKLLFSTQIFPRVAYVWDHLENLHCREPWRWEWSPMISAHHGSMLTQTFNSYNSFVMDHTLSCLMIDSGWWSVSYEWWRETILTRVTSDILSVNIISQLFTDKSILRGSVDISSCL